MRSSPISVVPDPATVCQLTSKRYNQLFLALMNAVRGSDSGARAARAFLLAETSETSRWPDDEGFPAAASPPLYQVVTRPRLRMLLEVLEAAARTAKREDIVLRERLTVEHVMPQQWQEHWPLPTGLSADAAERAAQRAGALHRQPHAARRSH